MMTKQAMTTARPVQISCLGAFRLPPVLPASIIQSVDHHQAQSIEQSRDREHQRIGIRCPPAQHEVEAEREDEQPEAVLEQVRREGPLRRQTDVQVGHENGRDRQQEQDQLDIAPGARTEGGHGGHGFAVPQVPLLALALWHAIAWTRRSVTSRRASSMLGMLTVAPSLLR